MGATEGILRQRPAGDGDPQRATGRSADGVLAAIALARKQEVVRKLAGDGGRLRRLVGVQQAKRVVAHSLGILARPQRGVALLESGGGASIGGRVDCYAAWRRACRAVRGAPYIRYRPALSATGISKGRFQYWALAWMPAQRLARRLAGKQDTLILALFAGQVIACRH
jgi:hypothetical protein